MAESVIVTLRTDSFCRDYALPSDIPMGELCPRLLNVLRERSKAFANYTGLILEQNGAGLLDRSASLADYGVCSGAYLDIVREEKYHGFR